MGTLKSSWRQISPPIACRDWRSLRRVEMFRDRVEFGLAPGMETPIASIGVVNDEVEAWETASVRVLCACHDSGLELHNARPHEFYCLRMQSEILRPGEACGNFARLSSTSAALDADQPVQFFPGFGVHESIIGLCC